MSIASQVFTLDSFADGAAGATGGVTAITVFFPLNVIRTQLQTDDTKTKERSMLEVAMKLVKEGGIQGLYKGWWGQVVALGCSNFIYFYTYQLMKAAIQKQYKRSITPAFNLVVGAAAGVINVLATTPLWMVSTQLMSQSKRKVVGVTPYKGMFDGLAQCYGAEGVAGLWKGLVPNLMLVSNPTIHFFTYERVRQVMERRSAERGYAINALEFFVMGAIAKTAATFATYPMQVAQSQLRNDRKNGKGERKYRGTLDCLIRVGADGGLYRGLFAKLWQTVLTAAFQFMTFEKLRVVVFEALTGKKLHIGHKAH